jgi:hypothetical protein
MKLKSLPMQSMSVVVIVTLLIFIFKVEKVSAGANKGFSGRNGGGGPAFSFLGNVTIMALPCFEKMKIRRIGSSPYWIDGAFCFTGKRSNV